MDKKNAGKRIHLYQMAGENDMMDLDGTIQFEDGIGQIHVKWDNGRTLAVNPEEDEYEILESKKIKGFGDFINEDIRLDSEVMPEDTKMKLFTMIDSVGLLFDLGLITEEEHSRIHNEYVSKMESGEFDKLKLKL